METQMGEKNKNISNIYLEYYIHKNHQLPKFSSTNWKEAPTPIYELQPEGSYNTLNSLASTGRRLQPPFFSPSFLP